MTPRIETQRLVLRPWEERDRDLFFEINSDPQVMEFFPFRRTREQADAFFDQLMRDQRQRLVFPAAELRDTGECIGFCGLHEGDLAPQFPAGTIEVGWRLAARHWGNGYATEGALAALEFAFSEIDLPEVVSFAVHDNRRSTAVMERIGMSRVMGSDFDHVKVPDTHPHLRRHVLYRLTTGEWARKKGG
ncbi:GNAT family N-acetyltransferase [Oricola thermophila]|uniref:GNAT family N-acetyltransferase n=1 Tax=Oricola thermophila TaxID=2742145 RepID=A0A6N1VE00_9HYPH|nr:GNAT family N-acetyltransferase [Oricola thermophila]QKV17267.1 GNAT family N-acetyltransferase [Oricola thermophila]